MGVAVILDYAAVNKLLNVVKMKTMRFWVGVTKLDEIRNDYIIGNTRIGRSAS